MDRLNSYKKIQNISDYIDYCMMSDIFEDMVRKDNIECCVCLDFDCGVKLPNCNHFICSKCYYKLNTGFISDEFYMNHPPPVYPIEPSYPYIDSNENLEIYNSLTNDDTYMEWFIVNNQDLYNSIKINSEFVHDIDIHLKKWFESNELISKYENDLIQYDKLYKKYCDDITEYNSLIEEEREDNINTKCPLCRQ